MLSAPLVALLVMAGCTGIPPQRPGPQETRLAACPATPNCVSSDEAGATHGVAPYRIKGDPAAAWRALEETLAQLPRTRVVTRHDDYMHVEFTSQVFRFVDDVEFHLRPQQNVIAVRSASRLGLSDLGANARRVERIRALLRQRDVIVSVAPAVGSNA